MEVVRAVLNTEQPQLWERRSAESYNNGYLLFDVHRYTFEWNRVIEDFTSQEGSILSIKRVQNPVQWGLFKIQEEKRRNEYVFVDKTTGYHVLHTDDLITAMKYPLDYRRYAHRDTGIQADGNKHPRFFNCFSLAFANARSSLSDANGESLIIKCEYYQPPKNQGDYYPSYVIRVTA